MMMIKGIWICNRLFENWNNNTVFRDERAIQELKEEWMIVVMKGTNGEVLTGKGSSWLAGS